jgi:hypothetical protein
MDTRLVQWKEEQKKFFKVNDLSEKFVQLKKEL